MRQNLFIASCNFCFIIAGRFVGSFHFCRVLFLSPPPIAVSLVPHPCSAPDSILKVYDIGINKAAKGLTEGHYASNRKFRYNYTVCISPLQSRYNNVHELVSTIEVNRIFGADHFIFYKHSPGRDVSHVTEYYAHEGLAHILPWNLPVSQPDRKLLPVWYFAQVVALNDCVYRSMIDSKYVVISDTDELIVPQVDRSWDDMIARVTTVPFACVWEVQNTFFRLDWEDDPQASPVAKTKTIVPLLKTGRETKLYPHKIRSKLILRPYMISIVGIHLVYQTLDTKFWTIQVNPEHGLVHHYRYGLDDGENTMMRNQVMLKYTDEIRKRVVSKLQLMGLTNHTYS